MSSWFLTISKDIWILINLLYSKISKGKVERIWYGIIATKCHNTRGSLEDPFINRKVKEKGREEEKTNNQANVWRHNLYLAWVRNKEFWIL